MKLMKTDGNIFMTDADNNQVLIANIKYGKTYGVNDKLTNTTVRLTVFPGHNSLEDTFVFHNGNKAPFQHIQSGDTNPILRKIYLELLVDENKSNCMPFLDEIIIQYFIKYMGYSLPDFVEIPERLFED